MKIYRIPILILLLLALSSCSRSKAVLEYFNVQEGAVLKIPVEHSTFPYPVTNINFTLKPPIQGHPDRDFSDIFQVEVKNKKNQIQKIKAVYDINGVGRDIQVQFESKYPSIDIVQITFNVACSGSISVISWKPL